MNLTSPQLDRARGVLVGKAIGDALGAGIEFTPSVPYPQPVSMNGGGAFVRKAGQWTDDTSMAIIIVRAAAEQGGLNTAAMDAIAQGFHAWGRDAPDVGVQTRAILASAARTGTDAPTLTAASAAFTAEHPDRAGNGSLMRTAVVALAAWCDAEMLATHARQISSLTHAHPDALDACVLWCGAVAAAVETGTVEAARAGVFDALQWVEPERRNLWRERIAEAEAAEPWDFPKNGWVVHAFQAAWAAVACTREHEGAPTEPFARGVDHAVRCGQDTDTVGAIAGALLGAIHGFTAMPREWVDAIHGWPGMRAKDLVDLADRLCLHQREPRGGM